MEQFPVELMYHNVLPYLKWNDLLRLRRVSKRTKSVSDAYIKANRIQIPDGVTIELNNSDRSLESFLRLGYPITKFFLNNKDNSHRFFAGEAASEFQNLYADKITHLEVSKLSVFRGGDERSFYKSLKRLKSLEIQTMSWKRKHLLQDEENASLPKCFNRLTSLKINSIKTCHLSSNVYFPYWNCKKLKDVTPSDEELCKNLIAQFSLLHSSLTQDNPQAKSSLEYIDLKNYHFGRNVYDWDAAKLSPYLIELCETLAVKGIKLRNVPARLFKKFDWDSHNISTVSNVIESMDGLHPIVRHMTLSCLKALTIDTGLLFHSIFSKHGTFQADWPALEHIDLSVSMINLLECRREGKHFPKTPVKELFKVLFGEKERTKMNSLRLNFSPRLEDNFTADLSTYPCPRICSIVSSCPNLVKLDITNWPDRYNLGFSKLWGGLRLLEEVSLTKCKLLGDEGFIGENDNSPAFLQLTRLKKLTLGSLEKMPKVTDKSFQVVFRHLKITHFEISSKKPIEKVTAQGIQSLLTGDFGESIESFPFANWSLFNLNDLQFAALATKFRSSYML